MFQKVCSADALFETLGQIRFKCPGCTILCVVPTQIAIEHPYDRDFTEPVPGKVLEYKIVWCK